MTYLFGFSLHCSLNLSLQQHYSLVQSQYTVKHCVEMEMTYLFRFLAQNPPVQLLVVVESKVQRLIVKLADRPQKLKRHLASKCLYIQGKECTAQEQGQKPALYTPPIHKSLTPRTKTHPQPQISNQNTNTNCQ